MAIRRYRDKAEWKRLVEEQAQSGMSGLSFCEQQGLSSKSFYRKRKVLRFLVTNMPIHLKNHIMKNPVRRRSR